jgi:ABC-type transport system substrate-binding protein
MAYSLPPNLIPQINGSLVRQVVPLFGSETLTPLTTHPPLNDIRVRRGINAALERPKIASTTWHGEVKPFAGFWPSTMRGYDSSIPTAPDLTAARDFLRGSGCDPKCDLTLSYSATAYPEHASEALVVQSSLKQVGIDLRLVDLDATTYFNNLTGQKFQLILQPIYDLTDVPDGLTAYGLIPEIQKALLSNLVIPGISTVVDRALTTTGATQDAALQAVQDQYLSHLPWFSLTDYALVTAQRVATSVAKVPSSSVVAVVRQNGDVR